MPITRTDSTQRGDVTSDADAKFRQPRVDVDRPASSADVRDEAIIIELEVTCRGLFELLQDAAATTHGAAEALGRNQRSSGPVRPGGPKHGGPPRAEAIAEGSLPQLARGRARPSGRTEDNALPPETNAAFSTVGRRVGRRNLPPRRGYVRLAWQVPCD